VSTFACARRYNTLMKLVFLGATFSIVYLMRYDKVIKVTYDRESDTFKHLFLVVPCLLLAVIFHNDGIIEVRTSGVRVGGHQFLRRMR